MKRMLRDAFDRWKAALVDQNKQTTQAARHRAHARVTSMEDLIAETPADDIEGVGIKLALYVYMSGVDPETADSAVEQVLSAYKELRSRSRSRSLGRSQEFDASMSAGRMRRCGNMACAGSTLQSSNRNYLTRQGRAGILAVPNAFDATHRSRT